MLHGEVVEHVLQGAALRLEGRGELGDEQGGADAVLVADARGVDAVAERLLVAVAQALDARDPLEARSGSPRGGSPALAAMAASSREDTIELANTASGVDAARARTCAPSSAPTSSPRSIRQSVPRRRAARTVNGTATAQRSASGSLAMHDVGTDLARPESSAASIAPGSSGLGKDTVGNVGVGVLLARDRHGRREPGPHEHRAAACRCPTPCRAVWTMSTSRGLSGATTTVAAAST